LLHSKAKAQRGAYRESLFLCGGGSPDPLARSAHQRAFIRGKKQRAECATLDK
jgi:hypothetical protein